MPWIVNGDTLRRNGARYVAAPPMPATTMLAFVTNDAVLYPGARTGNVDSLSAKSGNNIQLNCASGAFAASDVPQRVLLSGCANPANNGEWDADMLVSGTAIRLNAPGSIAQGSGGTWRLLGKAQSLTDRKAGLVLTAASQSQSLSVYRTGGANNKKALGDQLFYNGVLQNMTGIDAARLAPAQGNVPLSVICVAKRLTTANTQYFARITNATATRYWRANLTSNASNQIRIIRNDGNTQLSNIATSATINDTAVACWCWAYTNSPLSTGYKGTTVLGSTVPAGNVAPTTMDRLIFGPLSTVPQEGVWVRTWFLLASEATVADVQKVIAYDAFAYL